MNTIVSLDSNIVKVLGVALSNNKFLVKTMDKSFIFKDKIAFLRERRFKFEEEILIKLAEHLLTIDIQLNNKLNLNLKSIQIEISGRLKEEKLSNESTVDLIIYNEERDNEEVVENNFSNFNQIDITLKPTTNDSMLNTSIWLSEFVKNSNIIKNLRQFTQLNLKLFRKISGE